MGAQCSSRWRKGSGGFTLVETLISLALLGILFSGVAAGVMAMIRGSATANDNQRAETLAVSYSEVVKQLDYVVCATPDAYNSAFAQYEDEQPAQARLVPGAATAEVVSVDSGCGPTEGDLGRQVLNVEVRVKNAVTYAQVVKRDPDAVPTQLVADFSWSILNGGSANVGLVLDDATSVLPGTSILSYEWTFPTPPIVSGPDEDEIVRIVPAVLGSTSTMEVTLTVTDSAGRIGSVTKTITIPAALPSATTSTTSTTTTTTTTTIPSPPEGPAPAPVGFRKVGSGCCTTYGTFEWERVPFATDYLIRLDGYFLGGCVTDHSGEVPDPQWSPTPNGSKMTGSVTAFGLCLGSSYNVSIQAKVNNVWGRYATIRVTL